MLNGDGFVWRHYGKIPFKGDAVYSEEWISMSQCLTAAVVHLDHLCYQVHSCHTPLVSVFTSNLLLLAFCINKFLKHH